jgi:predicted dehydrogenase
MKKLGVIGLGSIATRHRNNLKQLYPSVKLYAMSASGRLPREKISDCDVIVTSVEELIEQQVEFVIVASPAPFHASHAIPFIEAGIPTLIEKPVAVGSQDIERLNKAIEEFRTPVAIGYCLRYLPSSLKMKSLLEEGVLGELYNAFIHIGQYLPDWRPNKNYRDTVSASKNLGGGALLELSHELDYAQWLLGEFEIEHAVLRSSKELDLDVEDIADIVLRTPAGVVCNVHLDFLQRSARRTCSIIGSKGCLEWDLMMNTITYLDAGGSEVLYSEPDWDKNQLYLALVQDFVAMIEGRNHNCIDVDSASKTTRMIEAIKSKANWSI